MKYWEIIADRLHAEGWSYGIAEHFTKRGKRCRSPCDKGRTTVRIRALGRKSTPVWRLELTRDDYYAEFLTAYSYAQMGLHENPLDLAVSRAKAAPLPEVPSFSDKRIRLLVAICRERQKMTGVTGFICLHGSWGKFWERIGRKLHAGYEPWRFWTSSI
jgi:hypothetical protein